MSGYLEIFQRFVPGEAAIYCLGLWKELGFEFQIKRNRQTKLGDYRYDPSTKKHTITINNDLNPYAFLITYLHEVAHHVTFSKYGRKVKPHGREWKSAFIKLAEPILKEEVLPEPVFSALSVYLKNPKAASCSDPHLYHILRQYDPEDADMTPLSEVAIGESFHFQGKLYHKLEKKRTRSVCQERATGRRYLISEVARVTPG